ncbi:hypothetical protein ACFUNF_35100 [Streptomyces sp. NPDC057291]|uniref:hypothetical protein n=1 Tax=Streptomyces sp. NPDC057291 TaxID=3346087 RepID=UPI0036348DDF
METDQWSLAVSALALLVAAWAIKYGRDQAVSARGQLDVARQVHREQNEPYVIVDVQPHDPGSFLLVLVIENVGPTMARNVKITASPELQSSHGGDVSEALQSVVARTIAMIPPGRKHKYFFDTSKRFQSDLPLVFEFAVTSDGPMGPVETLRYTVDLAGIKEELVGERPTKKLEEKVGKLADELRDLGKHYQAVNEEAIVATRQRRMDEFSQRLAQRSADSSGDTDS